MIGIIIILIICICIFLFNNDKRGRRRRISNFKSLNKNNNTTIKENQIEDEDENNEEDKDDFDDKCNKTLCGKSTDNSLMELSMRVDSQKNSLPIGTKNSRIKKIIVPKNVIKKSVDKNKKKRPITPEKKNDFNKIVLIRRNQENQKKEENLKNTNKYTSPPNERIKTKKK